MHTKVLVRQPEGKTPLAKPKPRWESNIKTAVKEMGWEGVGWICPAWEWRTVVKSVTNIRVP